MADTRRSTTAGAIGRAAATRPREEQRRHPADDLERARDDLEALIRRVRAGARIQSDIHDFDEEAQRIGRAISTNFRGPRARPSAAPLYVSPDGLSAAW